MVNERDPGVRYAIPHERQAHLELEGHSVKNICSNVRRHEGLLNHTSLVTEGVGHEGDLVLVEVVSETGSTRRVENQHGRDEDIAIGDKFIGVLANRHSGTSESGGLPESGIDLSPDIQLDLLSTGGVIGIATGIPRHMGHNTTKLRPIGLLARDDRNVNLQELCGPGHEKLKESVPIVLVLGTSAEVGKTTTSSALIRSFTQSGSKVAGTKIAGTGRMRDLLSMRDAGAFPWLDFPDVGLPTTYTSATKYVPAMYRLINLINSGGPDLIIAEAGGDPIEANIPTFLSDPNIMSFVKAAVVVPGDIMGAMGTIDYLHQYGLDENIFLTEPKGRNSYTSRERMHAIFPGIDVFNSLDKYETGQVRDKLANIFV